MVLPILTCVQHKNYFYPIFSCKWKNVDLRDWHFNDSKSIYVFDISYVHSYKCYFLLSKMPQKLAWKASQLSFSQFGVSAQR